MQISNFSTGGFVIHKITHLSRARISAWYAADGTLSDAEMIDNLGRSRPVRSPETRRRLRLLGQLHVRRRD